jgi:hypothetical protein
MANFGAIFWLPLFTTEIALSWNAVVISLHYSNKGQKVSTISENVFEKEQDFPNKRFLRFSDCSIR